MKRFLFAVVIVLISGAVLIYSLVAQPSPAGETAEKVQVALAPDGEALFQCSKHAAIAVDLTAPTVTQIIPGAAGLTIRICHLSVAFDEITDFALFAGTGPQCYGEPLTLSGVYPRIKEHTWDFTALGALRGGSGRAICIFTNGTVYGGGVVTYAQF